MPFAWINTEYKKLSEQGRKDLQQYVESKGFIRMLIVVDNIEVTRPQRTCGDMPNGAILWNGYNILGIKGNTLEKKYENKYDECECIQESGNPIDFSLIEK